MRARTFPRATRLLAIFLIVPAIAAACDQAPGPERISISEAQALVREELLTLDPEVEFTLEDVTTDEIWNEMGTQVYVLGGLSSAETYIIVDEQVDRLGMAFGGYGVTSMCITDLDRDGEPELAYTYSWGSGLHRSHVAVYLPHRTEPYNIDADLVYFDGDLFLERVDDHTVFLKAGHYDWRLDDFVAEATLGGLVLKEMDGQTQLVVELEDHIPPDILERIYGP